MIRFQIFELAGANLHKTLIDAMRTGELRTFEATRRGRRIQHKNLSYPGWMNWSVADGSHQSAQAGSRVAIFQRIPRPSRRSSRLTSNFPPRRCQVTR
jgi:hypothetical protein